MPVRTPTRLRLATFCWVGAAALAILWLAGCSGELPPGVQRVERAQLFLGSAPPPPGVERGIAVELPDRWWLKRRAQATEGWYRIVVELDPDAAPVGVMLEGARLNAELFFNGVSLGRVGRFEPPIARNPEVPLYFVAPELLVRPGRNVVDIHLATTPGFPGVLRPLRIGPDTALRPIFDLHDAVQADSPRLGAFLAWLLAALLLGEAIARATDRQAGIYLGCVAVAMGISGMGYFVTEIPLPSRLWEWLVGCLTHWCSLLLVLSAHRYLGLSRPRLERRALALYLALSVALAVVPWSLAFGVWVVWLGVAVIAYGYVLVLLVQGVRRGQLHPSVPIIAAIAIAPWVGMAARGLLFAIAALAWLTLLRSYRRLRDAERVQQVLEDKVAEREDEVRRSYEKLRELERSSAIAAERERLMRDMHDGTGGQLVSALAAARGVGPEGAPVVEILQDALDDLRLTIESLDPAARDLPSLLGIMRATLERRLAPSGLRLVWQVGEAGADRPFESEAALHLIRIVQEAVTNSIKHAGGAKVTIRTREGGSGAVWLEICDDGGGSPDPAAGGRGIGNMRSRAAAIGGELELGSSGEGTAVRLWLPDQSSERTIPS